MIQKEYPHITILPIRDQRDHRTWSYLLDQKIVEPYGNRKTLLYGGRDSFIPYYQGRYQTVELVGNNVDYSGTAIREEVARQLIDSVDFRKGVIYANYGRYPNVWPCVDVVVYDDGEESILLGRKADENQLRFIGGHVDPTDESYERAALRELHEEAGDIEVGTDKDAVYVCSGRIKDWRHAREDSEIFSTLFLFTKLWGSPKASDDIAEVKWVKVKDVLEYENYSKLIVPEHIEFFGALLKYLEKQINVNKSKLIN